jgi:hypothetical protein
MTDTMKRPWATHKERRKSERFLINLPLEYRMSDVPRSYGGVVINVSKFGLLVHSIKNMPVGTKLNIGILFPNGFELGNFEVVAEVVWKDLYWEKDWEGYEYGLKFVDVFEKNLRKLRQLLNHRPESREPNPNL